ncbi:hypothetical protein QFC22_004688 [Naganishia vaughanmartiniae]|uniref:Uncharacterized protein n=1 Tax=Naganishia vaughanmartiniae TaxID=1424756 RepID=A0ACC2X0Y7_9TREE|nr:hypothetical protein QFC22_004688 [Naganishia vaughanmartiniae]
MITGLQKKLVELRIKFQALQERHDKTLQENLDAKEAISAHGSEMKDALQQEMEHRGERVEAERKLEAMRAKCLVFAEKYLDASTTQKQFAEEYKEGLIHWQGKIKDLRAEREGLLDTIADQREELKKQDQTIQDARCVQIMEGWKQVRSSSSKRKNEE